MEPVEPKPFFDAEALYFGDDSMAQEVFLVSSSLLKKNYSYYSFLVSESTRVEMNNYGSATMYLTDKTYELQSFSTVPQSKSFNDLEISRYQNGNAKLYELI